MSARVADVFADTMIAHGIDRVFCVPGESFLSLLDALRDRPAVDIVVARHESGAGFMAVADARCTGRPGVCIVSRGPGATNASIAVHTAEQDASPLVVVVGQVPRADRGRGAFQEIDYARMFGGMAKNVHEVVRGEHLPAAFSSAHANAMSGTPGPVILVVPEDVWEDRIEGGACDPEPWASLEPSDEQVDCVVRALADSVSPLMLAGGALDSRRGRQALHRGAQRHGVPVALAYKRQDLFDNRDPLFGGYLGFKVPRAQVALLGQADLLLAVGARLTDVTTQNYGLPRPSQRLVHVYGDRGQIGGAAEPSVAVVADPVRLLERLSERDPAGDRGARTQWARKVHEYAAHLASYSPSSRPDGVEFGAVVQALARHAAPDAVVSTDGGNFGGWVHRLWPWTPAMRLIGAGSGAMGMGVPGAVAAALRFPDRQVLAFVGDGGFMMTGGEIATAVQHRLSLTVVVSNNRCFGTIRQQQERQYPGRAVACDLPSVDFAALAEACGARGYRVATPAEVEPVVTRALAQRGVCLIDVATSLEAISAYSPFAQRPDLH